METKLVIVESPAKAKTIEKILGKGYIVRASMGHVRDLPSRELGISIEKNFEPTYRVISERRKLVKEIKELANKSSAIYLATDPDREGESISWHIIKAANLEKDDIPLRRVSFHEITREAVEQAFKTFRSIDMDLVNAQQARRIVDRLVGYKLSPLLWRKVLKGLSAGRVQSAAVRLVVDREREISNFIAVEYWTITANLSQQKKSNIFKATLAGLMNGTKIEIHDKANCDRIVSELQESEYSVDSIKKKDSVRQPSPPFITSTLQQEASRKLRFTAKKTMVIAQQLYEGLSVNNEEASGLITYMRTDSTQMAKSAIDEIREYINTKYGKENLPAQPRIFSKKVKMAQEAHEAIRPTRVFKDPASIKSYLTTDQYKLYDLIWKRAVASQMAAAVYDTITINIKAGVMKTKKEYLLQCGASSLRLPGFMSVYIESKDEEVDDSGSEKSISIPVLTEKEILKLKELGPEQHFTQPPPSYTEASLIKALELKGIGRPSTYAPILSTIVDRGYVYKEGNKLHPEEIGIIVNDILVEHFSDIVDLDFTAKMEGDLDSIARGKKEWVSVISKFYSPFEQDLNKANTDLQKVVISSGELCPECGKPMVLKSSRYGKFLACSNYPECKGKKSLNSQNERPDQQNVTINPDEKCPECSKPMILKAGRYGKFLACSDYPKCKGKKSLNSQNDKPEQQNAEVSPDEKCPKCSKPMILKAGRYGKFLACSDYPKCKGKKTLNISKEETSEESCPNCTKPMLIKYGKFGKFLACSNYPDCKTTKRLYGAKRTEDKDPD